MVSLKKISELSVITSAHQDTHKDFFYYILLVKKQFNFGDKQKLLFRNRCLFMQTNFTSGLHQAILIY